MNQLSNLNATIVKDVFYDASLQPQATSINFTIENAHTNAFIEQIIITLVSAEASFGSALGVTLLDRGNGYPGQLNGLSPVTFTTISTAASTSFGTITAQNIVQNGNTIIIGVNQSVQDSEGLGNIYVRLNKTWGAFNKSFTLTVVYRPEATYNTRLDTRNQLSDCKTMRVLSQVGVASWADPTSTMTEQTNFVARNPNPRNNQDIATFGFNVTSSNPIFYFGTPFRTNRFFIGFSSDCTPSIGLVTFSFYNGSTFVGLAATQVYNGALGPGSYNFAYDGILIVTPPATWSAVQMTNDPRTIYNRTMIGLGTLATNNTINNSGIFWIQCQVGFATTATLTVATVAPLIDPAQTLTYRRRLI